MSVTPEGTSNPEAPNPQLPIAQKLRIRYAKRGRLRFTSHRDFSRAFERAVRRAGVPIAYSSGYTPHPKISYAGASPTGAASEAEYLEIGLTRPLDATQVASALDQALPRGLDILDVVPARVGSLADQLEASHWRIELPGVTAERLADAVKHFLGEPQILVERMTKKGLRTFDARGQVVRLVASAVEETADGTGCAILDAVVHHGTPSVRPDDVIVGLRTVCGLQAAVAPLATRLAQGPLQAHDGTVGDPLASDRDASNVGS